MREFERELSSYKKLRLILTRNDADNKDADECNINTINSFLSNQTRPKYTKHRLFLAEINHLTLYTPFNFINNQRFLF